jgi:serine acetyltransferase
MPAAKTGVLQDWDANAGAPEARLLLLLFRLAQAADAHVRPRLLARVLVIAYRIATRVLFGVELPVSVVAGPGLRVHHGEALVLNPGVRLGSGCTLRHSVTIGDRGGPSGTAVPVLGDAVEVGAGALILGPVVVGSGARIGSGAVVLHDVPDGGVVVGNPGRLVDQASES